ncbi:phosphotransferase family protein [Amycolatopsis sp. 3B14]|uniref:phosphotransferase family protein n=1 Tax=Amycolatopsis sp. 3B14 TaxID=3243600 RepID=UPI003D958473
MAVAEPEGVRQRKLVALRPPCSNRFPRRAALDERLNAATCGTLRAAEVAVHRPQWIVSTGGPAASVHEVHRLTPSRRTSGRRRDRRVVLDEITEPRLLHGDLWTANVLLSPGAPEPLIGGVLDHDRASWGDPAADWSLYAASRPDPVRDAFWAGYGRPADTAQARAGAGLPRPAPRRGAAGTPPARQHRRRRGELPRAPRRPRCAGCLTGAMSGGNTVHSRRIGIGSGARPSRAV